MTAVLREAFPIADLWLHVADEAHTDTGRHVAIARLKVGGPNPLRLSLRLSLRVSAPRVRRPSLRGSQS